MAEELVELGKTRCRPGKIWRKGYTAKHGARKVKVPGACVIDQGAPGKTPAAKRVLPTPKRGALSFWSHKKPDSERHGILTDLLKKKPCVTVIRDLNLLANLTKVTAPAAHATARADMEWIRKQPSCRLKSKGNA
jgi:hypothetical protein